jgi:hypothetical protein
MNPFCLSNFINSLAFKFKFCYLFG